MAKSVFLFAGRLHLSVEVTSVRASRPATATRPAFGRYLSVKIEVLDIDADFLDQDLAANPFAALALYLAQHDKEQEFAQQLGRIVAGSEDFVLADYFIQTSTESEDESLLSAVGFISREEKLEVSLTLGLDILDTGKL